MPSSDYINPVRSHTTNLTPEPERAPLLEALQRIDSQKNQPINVYQSLSVLHIHEALNQQKRKRYNNQVEPFPNQRPALNLDLSRQGIDLPK